MKKIFRYLLVILCTALLTACGGATQPTNSGTNNAAQPTKTGTINAVIKTTALSGLNIGGFQMSINLPHGVAPALNGGVIDAAAVEFVSAAPAEYKVQKAAYNSANSVLEFSVINLAGFSPADQIILHLIVSPGIIPLETDFSIKSYEFFDKVTGAVVTGLNPTLTTTIQ
jgi:hypothetical protein